MFSRYSVFLVLIFIALQISAAGQTIPEDDAPIRVETQIVTVPVTVNSAAGKPVTGLKASNFAVYEDGKRQEIADFSSTAAPFEIALLLDTSGSTRNDLILVQRAAKELISQLRAGDRVAIIGYRTQRGATSAAASVDHLSALTGDRSVLNAAIDRLSTSNGTPYYDSLSEIAEKTFAKPAEQEFRGRRAIIALTDGVDSTSVSDFEPAKDELSKMNIVCFFIKLNTRDFFEENLLGDCENAMRFSGTQIRRYYKAIAGNSRLEKAANFCQLGDFERLAVSKRLYEIADEEMRQLAVSSGGAVFPAEDLNDARTAFKQAAAMIGTQYTLSYYPSNDKKDGKYRKLKVEIIGIPPGAKITAREGYTAPSQ